MHYTGSPYMIITYEAALGFKKVGDPSHIEIQIHIYLFVASNKVTIKILIETVCSAVLIQETAKKPYNCQVNCHLKFGQLVFQRLNKQVKTNKKAKISKKAAA